MSLHLRLETQEFSNSTSDTIDITVGKTTRLDLYYKGYVDDIYFYRWTVDETEVEAVLAP